MRAARRPHGGRSLRPDSARTGAAMCRASAASTSTLRCCRAGAARRRSSAPSSPATRDTGISIMQMDAGLDTGPILLPPRLPIAADDTGASLHDKLAELGARLIVSALARLERGEFVAAAAGGRRRQLRRQDRQGRSRIDWREACARSNARYARSIRSRARHLPTRGVALKIWRARSAGGGSAPGTILAAEPRGHRRRLRQRRSEVRNCSAPAASAWRRRSSSRGSPSRRGRAA